MIKKQFSWQPRENKMVTYKGTHIKLSADLPVETLQNRRERMTYSKYDKRLKDKKTLPATYPSGKIMYGGEIKDIPDKEILRELITLDLPYKKYWKELFRLKQTQKYMKL